MPTELDHYEVLQVSPNAEPGVILAAYRRLAQTYHPDVNPDPRAPERMRRMNRALEILSDPEKRAEYDRRRLRRLAVQHMARSEEHTSELQSPDHLVCRLLLEKKKKLMHE